MQSSDGAGHPIRGGRGMWRRAQPSPAPVCLRACARTFGGAAEHLPPYRSRKAAAAVFCRACPLARCEACRCRWTPEVLPGCRGRGEGAVTRCATHVFHFIHFNQRGVAWGFANAGMCRGRGEGACIALAVCFTRARRAPWVLVSRAAGPGSAPYSLHCRVAHVLCVAHGGPARHAMRGRPHDCFEHWRFFSAERPRRCVGAMPCRTALVQVP